MKLVKDFYISKLERNVAMSILCNLLTWYPNGLYTWLLDIRCDDVESEAAHFQIESAASEAEDARRF